MARQTSRKQPGVRMSEITPRRIVPSEPQPLHLHLSLDMQGPSPSGWTLAAEDAPKRSVLSIDGEDLSDGRRAASAEPAELPAGACVIVLDLD